MLAGVLEACGLSACGVVVGSGFCVAVGAGVGAGVCEGRGDGVGVGVGDGVGNGVAVRPTQEARKADAATTIECSISRRVIFFFIIDFLL